MSLSCRQTKVFIPSPKPLKDAIGEQSVTVVAVKTKHTDIGVIRAEQQNGEPDSRRGFDENC